MTRKGDPRYAGWRRGADAIPALQAKRHGMPLDRGQIRKALRDIFTGANVFDIQAHGDALIVTVCADERGVQLRFQDMPRIAEAMGTERLDFIARAGKDILDSYTFDGCVLTITARYG